MVTTSESSIAYTKKPLLGQSDLRMAAAAAERLLLLRPLAAALNRSLTTAELQLLAAVDALHSVIEWDAATGLYTLRPVDGLPVAHQPRLEVA